jgi:ATP-dependent protease Clp ATPase subunit
MRLRTLSCSFCRRNESEVEKLVAGPMRLFGRVYICDRCAAQTIHIMQQTADDNDQPSGRSSRP